MSNAHNVDRIETPKSTSTTPVPPKNMSVISISTPRAKFKYVPALQAMYFVTILRFTPFGDKINVSDKPDFCEMMQRRSYEVACTKERETAYVTRRCVLAVPRRQLDLCNDTTVGIALRPIRQRPVHSSSCEVLMFGGVELLQLPGGIFGCHARGVRLWRGRFDSSLLRALTTF